LAVGSDSFGLGDWFTGNEGMRWLRVNRVPTPLGKSPRWLCTYHRVLFCCPKTTNYFRVMLSLPDCDCCTCMWMLAGCWMSFSWSRWRKSWDCVLTVVRPCCSQPQWLKTYVLLLLIHAGIPWYQLCRPLLLKFVYFVMGCLNYTVSQKKRGNVTITQLTAFQQLYY